MATLMSEEQRVQAEVDRALADMNRAMPGNLRPSDCSGVRMALHDLVSRATRQWAPVREGQVVFSVAKVDHQTCPKWVDDGPSAVMDLVDTDREAPVFRCRLCGDEVLLMFSLVTASELRSTPATDAQTAVT